MEKIIPRKINTHWYALAASIVTLLLGPLCIIVGQPISGFINQNTDFQAGLYPFFGFGLLYALVILAAFGLGIYGLIRSPKAAKPRRAIMMSAIGLVLIMPSLCFFLLVWGSFAVMPCGLFSC